MDKVRRCSSRDGKKAIAYLSIFRDPARTICELAWKAFPDLDLGAFEKQAEHLRVFHQ